MQLALPVLQQAVTAARGQQCRAERHGAVQRTDPADARALCSDTVLLSASVKRRRDGTMALRWCAAGMIEAGKQFRRVNGHLHLPRLRAALDASFTGNVSPANQNENKKVA